VPPWPSRCAPRRPPPPRAAERGEELWRPGLTQELRASGKPWFLHFTAAGASSCQVNEKKRLRRPPRGEGLPRDKGIAAVKADWTARDTGIANELARFGRQGIPFYVLSDGKTGIRPSRVWSRPASSSTSLEKVR
jgi:thiol:disulfide interchange protein DsbD